LSGAAVVWGGREEVAGAEVVGGWEAAVLVGGPEDVVAAAPLVAGVLSPQATRTSRRAVAISVALARRRVTS
jgi:hypothetical protein